MPYIKKFDKNGCNIRKGLQKGERALNAGELNYQIFYYVKHNFIPHAYSKVYKQIKKYVDNFLGDKPNYQRYNDMTGCLIRCEKEIYRRLEFPIALMLGNIMNSYDEDIDKYEDIKIDSNGDVE